MSILVGVYQSFYFQILGSQVLPRSGVLNLGVRVLLGVREKLAKSRIDWYYFVWGYANTKRLRSTELYRKIDRGFPYFRLPLFLLTFLQYNSRREAVPILNLPPPVCTYDCEYFKSQIFCKTAKVNVRLFLKANLHENAINSETETKGLFSAQTQKQGFRRRCFT
jgi:hypothetical protein